MADLNIRLEIKLTPRIFRWIVAALLLFGLAPELATESVTLSTYYPAPSGVYNALITTQGTYLARDSGNVAIGTTNATAKLTVEGDGSGNAYIGGNFCGGNYTGISLNNQIGGCGVYNILSSPSDPNLYINRPTNYSILFRENNSTQMILDDSGRLGINTTAPEARLDVNGDIIARRNCSTYTYISGTTACTGYATLAAGIIVSRWELGYIPDVYNNGKFLCCSCPTGGCPF